MPIPSAGARRSLTTLHGVLTFGIRSGGRFALKRTVSLEAIVRGDGIRKRRGAHFPRSVCNAQLASCTASCGAALCTLIGHACHAVDPGSGPLHDCHELGHAGDATQCFTQGLHASICATPPTPARITTAGRTATEACRRTAVPTWPRPVKACSAEASTGMLKSASKRSLHACARTSTATPRLPILGR